MQSKRSTFKRLVISLIASATLATLGPVWAADDAPVDAHMRSPADELATIQLPAGYHLELVASDPDVVCPCLCVWDGDGRMYVAELRSYMLDINGTKAHTPISRVSRWEQTHNDGIYDKHTVYVDHMMLPRMVLPLDDRVLIRETDTKDIYSYRDTTGIGVADEKTKFYEGGKQEGNLEHQPSGLIWDIDNWIYVTNQNQRFRYTRQVVEREQIPFHPGQWGIATTDTGQVIFNTAGNERPAHNFQVMPQYGDIELPDELSKDFTAVHPIENLTDVEGGLPRLRPEGGLNRFSGCAGGSVYRGDSLPDDLYGDYILPEPVGRLIRRAKVSDIDGKRVISNPDNKQEFIASTDPNFRPVWSATGPDGLLYFCDMYHGIIQEANWTKEGTYLRPQIKKYGLQKNIGRGRIWRLVHDGFKARPMPHMLEETAAQLVEHLSDKNGWWRDTAQKLIILKGDKSVVPALIDLARRDENPIARLHALWTLEGLDSLTNDLLIEKLKDPDARLRSAAVRIAEPSILYNDPSVVSAIKAMATDPDAGVAEQVCLSMLSMTHPDADATVTSALAAPRDGKADTNLKALVDKYRDNEKKAREQEAKDAEMAAAEKGKGELFKKGREAYGQTCIACHAADGKGMPAPEHDGTTIAPPLAGSRKLLADKQLIARIVLHGLTGPNNGVTYPGQMASFKWATDEWLASILTYARNDWGNKAPAISPEDVAGVRNSAGPRDRPFTIAELYEQVESAAPITPDGARPTTNPGEIVVDPSTANLHGKGIRVDCYSSGLDIGYWDSWQDWVSWKIPVVAAGDYDVTIRTTNPAKEPHEFSLRVGGKQFFSAAPTTKAWEEYVDVSLGTVHIEQTGDVVLEFHPRSQDNWGPTNVSAIKLIPLRR